MVITVKTLLDRAIVAAQDAEHVHWSRADWVSYLNDGQREIGVHRPDALGKTAVVPCVEGARQSLPADGVKLIEVRRNASEFSARAVRLCSREMLDAQAPHWQGSRPAREIVHFLYDPREPRTFWVWPPALPETKLELYYSARPVEVAETTADTALLSVEERYAGALLDYMLYRAYAKDAEGAGNAARAQAHFVAFTTALGVDATATAAVMPNTHNNPNT